jgi:hypothetical protein
MADNKQRPRSSFLNIPSPTKRTENAVPTLPAGCLEGTSAETTARKRARTQEQADAAKRAQHQYYETVTKPKRAAEKALKEFARKLEQEKLAEASNEAVPQACGRNTAEGGKRRRIGRLRNHNRYGIL